jgi:hypothetical protein
LKITFKFSNRQIFKLSPIFAPLKAIDDENNEVRRDFRREA